MHRSAYDASRQIAPEPMNLLELDDATIMYMMVEGRNISTRRMAHKECIRRVSSMREEISALRQRLEYSNSLATPKFLLRTRHRTFIVNISRSEYVIYHEPSTSIHVVTSVHHSEFRSSLELLLASVEKFGNDISMYINSEYAAVTIRQNISKWMSNGYKTYDDKDVKNKDLLIKLVECGTRFDDVHMITSEHNTAIKYAKELYQNFNMYTVTDTLSNMSMSPAATTSSADDYMISIRNIMPTRRQISAPIITDITN